MAVSITYLFPSLLYARKKRGIFKTMFKTETFMPHSFSVNIPRPEKPPTIISFGLKNIFMETAIRKVPNKI